MDTTEKIKVFGDKVTLKEAMKSIRTDAWSNPFTGLGTVARDKAMSTVFEADARLSDDELEDLYNGEDLAATIASVVPDEMLRQGYDVKIEVQDSDQKYNEIETEKAAALSRAVKDAAKALDVQSKFIEAMTWARVFGGSALYLGCDDGARDKGLAEPLNEKAITAFDHVNVLDKRYMVPLKWYSDPTAPKFGFPSTYLITPEAVPVATLANFEKSKNANVFAGAAEVHESRMIIFRGTRTTTRERQRNNGWDLSLLQRCHAVLRQFGIGWSALTHILQDANQAVFKMDGLIDALASRDFATVQARMQLIDMSRSVARAVVLDKDSEEFERQNFNWSGIDQPFDKLILRLCSCARIPATMLMGQSPAGLDATGESDIRWFYDTVRTARENDLDPKLRRVHELIMRAKQGPTNGQVPEQWSLQYPSLWQTTPKEEAEIRGIQAETDVKYIQAGVLLPEEVALSRFTADGWRPETTIDAETRVLMLESDREPVSEPELVNKTDATEVQSLIFAIDKFNEETAKAWAQKHKYHAMKVDVTKASIRLRQGDPDLFDRNSFRTIELTEGVKAVIGKLL